MKERKEWEGEELKTETEEERQTLQQIKAIFIHLSISEPLATLGGSLTLVISLSLAAVLVPVSTILIIVVVLLARSRARALRQLESLRESTQRGNVTYEEMNLPPVDIDTSKNVAYGHVQSHRHIL